MSNGLLLWADDEIDLLKAHVLFLEKKGYDVVTVTNGTDAIDQCRQRAFDLVLLDEMMPGLSGLETLQAIKTVSPSVPVVMVTKSEEENIMDQAIGAKIADYLIKPVNPNQILLTLKKNIHRKEIVSDAAQTGYQKSFAALSMQIDSCKSAKDFMDVYRKLVHWEIELESTDSSMREMLAAQKEEADAAFARLVRRDYLKWIEALNPTSPHYPERMLMSPGVFKSKVFPLLDAKKKVFLIVIDNFRYDQWKTIERDIARDFDIDDDLYVSILPTVTQYARNALFSGLMPERIAEMYPELWVDEDDPTGKNLNESPLIGAQIERFRRHDTFAYTKINSTADSDRMMKELNNNMSKDLNVIVFNFIDMLSHARTDSKMARELASDEAAYRSITLSWFRHSVIADLFNALAETDRMVVVTTDHGSIRTDKPIKIIGDKNTNTNLRYKIGKNLSCDSKDIFVIRNPKSSQLPAPNLSSTYVFATGNTFFAYPNNYNYYVSYFKDTFQHGGVSLEEMMIPIITLTPKKR